MSGSGQKKSLTEPPTNLKEAIDWVLRVSGRDSVQKDEQAVKVLADELKKLLDKDASEVAGGVLRFMGKSITDLAESLGKKTETAFGDGKRKTFAVLEAYLQTFKRNLENVRDYGSRVSEQELEKLKEWFTGGSSGTITQLAEGLRKFLGYGDSSGTFDGSGIIISGGQSYEKAYGTASWPQNPDDKRTSALIFLGIAPMLFYGLTYLYWWCEGQGGWSSKSLTGGTSTLSKYMTAIGFDGKYLKDNQNTGKNVAQILKTAFDQELGSAMQSAKKKATFIAAANANKIPAEESKTKALSAALKAEPSYPLYLKTLEQRGQSTTEYPLSRSHIIATPFFTPNSTYDVESSSPTTSSFLGYSGLAGLAGGAYGLNLGGLGTLMSALLA
ncbi:variant erythrocyte surface antigen-1 family protein [Babesia caballi]|uniref:Variant erythrocyte surface antigen-1 family protein n=1 Tax=Babesia caballi TaxID=5871 RepID=A0AAV4LS32_BABCB|nr:variant erythrocyte surface antigen-1 family protein [Babesia caballi]